MRRKVGYSKADYAGGDAQVLGGRQEEVGERGALHPSADWRAKVRI
jgi:hypothetical protein